MECSEKHHVPFACLHSLLVPFFEHVAAVVVSSCRASGSVAVLVHSRQALLDLLTTGVSRRLA